MMWKLVFMSIGVVIATVLGYLPYIDYATQFTPTYTQLRLEATHNQLSYLDRSQPNQALISHSEHLSYSESDQQTQLAPFQFTGIHSGRAFTGQSDQALLTQDIISLSHQVIVQQAQDNQSSQLNTENLIIDSKNNLLFSPSAVTLTTGQQTTSANQFVGNYQEGWYDFTQQVHSQWE